jgi:hypothetical protein
VSLANVTARARKRPRVLPDRLRVLKARRWLFWINAAIRVFSVLGLATCGLAMADERRFGVALFCVAGAVALLLERRILEPTTK